jgi:thiamine-monophosphate kinase
MTFSGEFERIARLRAKFHRVSPEVELGIGDDCAILRPSGPVAVSVDVQVEDVHFKRAWAPWSTLGRRAVMAAASDLAAMGSRPIAIFSALVLTRSFEDDDLDELTDGFAQAADALGAPIAGGNLASGSQLSITTTVIGAADRALTRAGARPGDELWVTGEIGARGLGLEALLRERTGSIAERFVRAWLEPEARIAAGLALAPVATSAIDVSDGLLQDAGHLAESSNARAVIELDRVPLAGGAEELAASFGLDARTHALTAGDDYELVFTLPPGTKPPIAATHIGRIEAGTGAVAIDATGRPLDLRGGYQHFGDG